MRPFRVMAAVLTLLLSGAATARGQGPTPDPAETAPWHFGPLSLTPRFELLNVGVDSNVFYEAENPKEDFTATFRPSLDATLRFGPGRLIYRSWMDAVYFRKYEDERSLNRFGEVRLEARLTRFVPYVTASGLASHDRPNHEIDQRAERDVQILGGGASLLLFSRTSLVGDVRRQQIRYADNEFFRGENLAKQLDETRETAQGGVRLALTPLTTLAVLASGERDRFDLSPERDADSLRIAPSLEFDPTALVSGSVTVGYRRFTPVHHTMPRYSGVVAQVATRYTLLGRTRFDLLFGRDVDYSYDPQQPYYLRTGGTLTITQLLVSRFDAQVIAGRERLDYRAAVGTEIASPADQKTDVVGGGVGYRFADTTRVGVNIEFTRRRAEVPTHSFDRRRIFGAVSYGF